MRFPEIGGEALKWLHEGFANASLVVVALHLIGVIFSSLEHRENLLAAMITGYKRTPAREDMPCVHGIVAAVLIAAIAAFGCGMTQGKLPALTGTGSAAGKVQHEHHADHEDH